MANVIALRSYLRNVIGLGTDAVGQQRVDAVIDERISSIPDLAELNQDNGVKTLTANVRKTGGTIVDPT